jgi:branched-chain amino acid transport system permease protein
VVEVLQQVVDGLSRGGTYALLGLGLAVVFGVMHLVNFAHGELLTVAGYTIYAAFVLRLGWWAIVPLAVVASVVAAMATERVAFRHARNADDFTLLLTSFGVSILVQAAFRMYVSPKPRQFERPGWIFDRIDVLGVSLEVYSLVVIAVVAVTLLATWLLVQRTSFGIMLRAAAYDFDAARLMGVRANRVILGVFALSGALAGLAGVLWLIRSGQTEPTLGLTPLLKGLLAAIVGGLGSLGGAVVAGFALGLAEVLVRNLLPGSLAGLTDGVVFAAIAILFVVRPQGLFTVASAERV